MRSRKHALTAIGVGAAALTLTGLGLTATATAAPHPSNSPVTCSLDADGAGGHLVLAACSAREGAAVKLTVYCQSGVDVTLNLFRSRSLLADTRCEEGPTLASLEMIDWSTHETVETLVPKKRIA
jgi:hypothetical protein